mmetsp:Transcript_10722/g.40146  ORF Transcript_10722/g.40146 Transcript_10722/m.40146 type:complete len:258 (+) Transcript_10722:1113-1886(+)
MLHHKLQTSWWSNTHGLVEFVMGHTNITLHNVLFVLDIPCTTRYNGNCRFAKCIWWNIESWGLFSVYSETDNVVHGVIVSAVAQIPNNFAIQNHELLIPIPLGEKHEFLHTQVKLECSIEHVAELPSHLSIEEEFVFVTHKRLLSLWVNEHNFDALCLFGGISCGGDHGLLQHYCFHTPINPLDLKCLSKILIQMLNLEKNVNFQWEISNAILSLVPVFNTPPGEIGAKQGHHHTSHSIRFLRDKILILPDQIQFCS